VGTSVTDGSVTWLCVGTGTAYALVAFAAESTGPLPATAGTLTGIETPVFGWSTVYNQLDETTLGSDLETDAALRFRREQELRAQGNSAMEAIRQAVLAVDGVTSCTVFENDTDTTDADGVPPHAIEVMVLGGTTAAIAAAIFASKAAGVATHGDVSDAVQDSQGVAHTVSFTRPTEVPIYVYCSLVIDSAWPLDGADQIKQELTSWAAEHFLGGVSVYASQVLARLFHVAGVVDAETPLIGASDPPTLSDPIIITSRQLATFDSSRITVATTPA
jgi:uncharacterized phage protein gp47/JayE